MPPSSTSNEKLSEARAAMVHKNRRVTILEIMQKLTLSNPIFLPPAYSPALIYFGLERGWWNTCPYYMRKSVRQALTAERENKRNKKSVGSVPTLERNRKIIMSDEVRRWIGKG
jgi:hypothetical protein